MTHVAVVGANGRTGRLLAIAAERAGFAVIRITRHEADATDVAALRAFVAKADVVVSCVGPGPRSANGVLQASTRALLGAGARRIVSISASGPYTEGDGLFLARIVKPVLWRFLGATWRDMLASDRLLAASGAEWTSMRPPQLTDGPARGYRRALGRNVAHGIRITRADLARAIVDAIGDPATIRTSVSVAN
ncbi:SDR family oxidoreductase [Microbacterium caowuchunii]|uniref:NAD(P)-dependent oxidoreductase n=1 Tax=Microbacterium caowuchunii TaxID=2614638 RepID=UPI001246DEFF|nr:NAD(P)-binding oxidoreductase [Microbacterium caowuchunii]QEW00172.1 SDR family oxidoreductase [Microbacterium caowuchunii]